MKKIFVPTLALIAVMVSAPSYARWGDTYQNFGSSKPSIFSADSDAYWLNKFRGYKKYPVHFYTEKMLRGDEKPEVVKTVSTHEYKHNVIVSAKVGQRMFDSSSYQISQQKGKETYRATTDGLLYTGLDEIKISENQLLKPLGEVKINGNYYVVLELPETSYVIMADTKGYVLDALGQIEHGNLLVPKDVIIVRPHGFQVEEYRETKEITGDTRTNFEIQYMGLENYEFMVFQIIEGGHARNEFIPISEKNIVLQNTKFEVIYAGPDYIEYKILD
ncbi:MAG: hypothetical protein J6039_00835 [Alphaproteobacteria bacterium]|nr:hypothetical protein [Alphaproteobacteria bacterium]